MYEFKYVMLKLECSYEHVFSLEFLIIYLTFVFGSPQYFSDAILACQSIYAGLQSLSLEDVEVQ